MQTYRCEKKETNKQTNKQKNTEHRNKSIAPFMISEPRDR